jgi:hypothetical protein
MMSEREPSKPSFTPTPKRAVTAEDRAAAKRYEAGQKEYDTLGTALARSKDGMPLSAAQRGAMRRNAAQHRAFKKLPSGRSMGKR